MGDAGVEVEKDLISLGYKKNEVKEFDGKLNELSLERYSIASGDDSCVLRLDGNDITQIPISANDVKDVKVASVSEINIIEGYLYYEVRITKLSGDIEIVLARVPKSGGESERINIPRKK